MSDLIAASAAPGPPSRLKLVAAFAAVYIVWGSTYLAIRHAVDTLPPMLMAAARFLVSGAVLIVVARARGVPAPTRSNWRAATLVGGLLLLGGNGLVCWSEQYVPSGLTALIVATVPLWMVLLEWLMQGGRRPGLRVVSGLVLGSAGVAVIANPAGEIGGGRAFAGVIALLFASFFWAAGSVHSRRADLPRDPILATGLEMIGGGALLAIAGLVRGEAAGFDPAAVSAASLAGLLYLVVFGSLIGFTAYVWLLQVARPAAVATYAYVNPIVAVLLGWALAGEAIDARILLAGALIVTAVCLITLRRRSPAVPESARSPVSPAAAPGPKEVGIRGR